ncbi:MAG: helix-turn-helix domain-containing protein [Anaerovoracaceae bacterium]
MDYEKTGKLIQELRKEKELTQMSLADKLGVTDRAVSKWERGKSFPDVSILRPLAEALGISVSELLDGNLRSPDKIKQLPAGTATMSVQDADNAALKGIHTYIDETQKKERIWKVIFVILMLIYVFNVSWLCRERSAPVTFKESNLEFSKIRVVMEDESVQMIPLDDSDGEQLKIQIQNFLREEMPEAETMGRLEILPRESARSASVNLVGLITLYEGVYYDQKSYEYYTFPDIGRIHQMIYSMCINQLTEGGDSN